MGQLYAADHLGHHAGDGGARSGRGVLPLLPDGRHRAPVRGRRAEFTGGHVPGEAINGDKGGRDCNQHII